MIVKHSAFWITLLFFSSACTGAVQTTDFKRNPAASTAESGKFASSSDAESQSSGGVASTTNMSGVTDQNNSVGSGVGPTAAGAQSQLLWMVVGDYPADSENLRDAAVCATTMNVNRSACQTRDSRCRSSFNVTCDSSENCHRLFKCTTGQGSGLIWFPMGDNIKKSDQLSTLCSSEMNISGSSCQTVNDRCLSKFCTSGSGEDCGRRIFKCLTSGESGKLYLRWVGDKPVGELAGIGFCSPQQDIAGSSCSAINTTCQSSFCTEGEAPSCIKRRLFKCTP